MVSDVIPQKMKTWIDKASYIDLLEKWRYEPVGSIWFSPPVGSYFSTAFKEMGKKMTSQEKSAASKKVGY